ncbi:MAG: TetR/AcrR family transcriptional regulator [Ignavibacteriae bacterium]|nr:TetR/AcrR family transcriptional regulator [Ignavibacteriota bacterium]NOG97899.1 TetR/AcrR family transcriptional regulator [Ignavibacteriota bacterium]
MQNDIQKYLTEKFQKEGVQTFTLTKIANEMHISKKTIYKDFESKEALIDKTIMDMLNNAYTKVINIIAEKSPFIVKFYSIFDIVKDNLKAFDDSSLSELKRHYPATWIKAARFRKYNIIPLLRLLIRAGVKKGVLNDYPEELYLKLIYGAVSELTKGNNKNFQEEIDILLQIVLNGALTKKGKKFLNYRLVNVN